MRSAVDPDGPGTARLLFPATGLQFLQPPRFLDAGDLECLKVVFQRLERVFLCQVHLVWQIVLDGPQTRDRRNVRLICADARMLLSRTVPANSVQTLHVYFPDPWWKTRHHKRRLFTAEFAAVCERVLRPGGRLHFVTDVEDYFQMAKELLAGQAGLCELPPLGPSEPKHDLDYLTNFERKFRKEGRPIWRAVYEKRD